MSASKVDRYIVYQDGEAKTVWAWRSDAIRSAIWLARSGLKNVLVVKHPKRCTPYIVAR